jgi:serine phosphatase RsbU (regulator of sigma subunit)
MAVLHEVHGEHKYPIRGKVTILGRDLGCHIVINVGQVSAWHALIVNLGGVFYVEDLRSLNGTSLNGKPLQQRTRLTSGDQLELPGVTFTFQTEPRDGGPAVIPPLAELPPTEPPAAILSSIELARGLRVQVAPEAKLRAVLEIVRYLGTTLALDDVLPKILEALFSIFPQADQGFILLRDLYTGRMDPKAVRHRSGKREGPPAFSRTVIDHALATGRAILSADAGEDERFNYSESIKHLRLHSVMCVPLLSQDGTPLGIIQLDTQDQGVIFRQEDLEVLLAASTQAERAVELAQLYEERRELEAARRIQNSFLPAQRPSVAGLRFYDYYAPALHVGGDYFDYIPLPGDRLAVALGDVSGKGVPAALLMARLSAAVRFCLATAPSVAEAVRQLNAALPHGPGDDHFVTFVVGIIDLDRFTVTLANAGHMPPLRRRGGDGIEPIGEGVVGLPLAGIDMPYEEVVVQLQPGDNFILYTDGVTEARGVAGDFYGAERFQAAVAAAPNEPEAIGAAIIADVRRFAGERPQGDDLTVVCFGRSG